MLVKNARQQLTNLVESTAAALDIPDHVYEDATVKYEDVADWLTEEGSSLAAHAPDVFPQGSFRLGTVVRPISDEDQYDIDLICVLAIDKHSITREGLKKM